MRPKSFTLTEFAHCLQEFITRQRHVSLPSQPTPFPSTDAEEEFNDLALSLFTLQFAHVEPYRKFCLGRRLTPETVEHWRDIPAVPSRAFKEFEMTSLPREDRPTVFFSSGTTTTGSSRHFHNATSLAIYEASLLIPFHFHLLPESSPSTSRPRDLLALTPSPEQVPHSSLVHMFETLRRRWFEKTAPYTGFVDTEKGWILDLSLTRARLQSSVELGLPLLILGTAFSYVHLLDDLAQRHIHITLPPGSRLLETGGYKGRSRTVAKSELYALLSHHLGVPPSHIISEYGMSELSSQAYDHTAGQTPPANPLARTFQFPPWTRALVVSPETGRPAAPGESGPLRILDLANVYSVLNLQTEDLAFQEGRGFRFAGRVPTAEIRGCSLLPSAVA